MKNCLSSLELHLYILIGDDLFASVYCDKKCSYKLPIFLAFYYHNKMINGYRVCTFRNDFFGGVEIPSIF